MVLRCWHVGISSTELIHVRGQDLWRHMNGYAILKAHCDDNTLIASVHLPSFSKAHGDDNAFITCALSPSFSTF